MSTKIFNGYMLGFSAMTDIWVIDQWASVFRKRISHMEDDLRARLFATVTATLVDRIALLDDPKRLLSIVNGLTDENAKTLSDHRTPFMVAFEHIANHEKKIRETSMRDPDYDFECNVQILHVPGRNILLAMLFTEQEAYRILWRRMPHVQEYAYWNSTDQPSYLTDEQWDRRRRDWDKALGEDNQKELFEINVENLGLRFDQTVSLARFMAMHQQLPLPFKRYQIGKVWRLDEPQKNRYREITQADVDIVGGKRVVTDAEVLAAAMTAYDKLGISYMVRINDRRILNGALAAFGVADDLQVKAIRAIDKLDKIGKDGVTAELLKLGLKEESVDGVMAFITKEGINAEKLDYAESIVNDKESVKELRELLDLISMYKLNGEIEVDFSTARGLDYYTGVVFETMEKKGAMKYSMGSGGRYDNLIGKWAGKELPAVGISIGIDRVMDSLGYESAPIYTYAAAFVVYVKEDNFKYALTVANDLRAKGLNIDINLAGKNLANQLAYANSLHFSYAIIIGNEEEKQGKLKLRDLSSGSEELLSVEEAVARLRKE